MKENLTELYSLYLNHPEICTDTRKIIPGSIFFALKGDNFNANKLAANALEKGCAYAVIDEAEYKTENNSILVDNVLQTLQQLAAYHRKQLTIPVIGITGTNGKTTTKELISKVLGKKFKLCSTRGNFNNHVGVPLTLLSIGTEVEIAVVEMGANHPGEIGELCKISMPDFGIITNIGKSHLEGFGNIEGVINTKKELYNTLRNMNGKVFVNRDNSLLMNLSNGMERITYGIFPDSDCTGEIIGSDPFLKIKWFCKSYGKHIDISTNLVGVFNFENVLAAVCIGDFFGVDPEDIKDALESYIPSNNRSQIIKTKKNTLIMDAYNANPTSMDVSLRSFAQISCERKFAIIGDMLELGIDSLNEHKKILELLESTGFEKILLVGKIFTSLKNFHKFPVFTDVLEAANHINEIKPEGYNIFIKGSRGIKLEKLLEYL